MSYRCPTCGCSELPPAARKAEAEFKALSDRERKVAYLLIWHQVIHGRLKGDWSHAWHECMALLVPSFSEAEEVCGDISRVIMDNHDPAGDVELPEAWDPSA